MQEGVSSRQLDTRAARQGIRATNSTVQISLDYLACLKDNSGDASECRDLSKLYLQCRMDRYSTGYLTGYLYQ